MDHGGTNETAATGAVGAGAVATGAAGTEAPAVTTGERELSTGAAVAATVLAALGAAAVLLAVFHWLGWTVPGVGWLLAKGAVKLCAGGVVGLLGAVAWLRQRYAARR